MGFVPVACWAAALNHDTIDQLEDSFGNYEIICALGEGSMGIVYLAEQITPIRREVAIKALKLGLDSCSILRRFETERQALALMKHPNIAVLHDAGSSARGRPYFVMEFVEGEPITTACDQRSCDIPERLGLFLSVCYAIEHAHRKGIVHRDIKPSNVLVTERDGLLNPKVIDFGIARAISGHLTGTTITTTFGEVLGTPEYMSPEQAAFDGSGVGQAADIYSLGVLLYELLASVLPFDRAQLRQSGMGEALRILQQEEAPAPVVRLGQSGLTTSIAERRRTTPAMLRRALSSDLAQIMSVCLQKDPRRRYCSASALADDIKRYLRKEPVLARGPTVWYRVRRRLRRHRTFVGSLAITLSISAAGFWTLRRPFHPLTPLNIRPLTSFTGAELQPSFSPDGKRFAFVWDGGTGNFDVYVKPVDGGSPTRVTHDIALDLFPAWSPDGRDLAFIRVSPSEKSLYVVPSDGGQERKVASLNSHELAAVADMTDTPKQPGPAWSPDGKSIVVADSRDGLENDALYDYNLNGGTYRRLTQADSGSLGDSFPAFSPDRRFLAFVRNISSRGGSSIYLLELRTGKLRRILSEERTISGLAWMSNQDILFSSNRTGPDLLWQVPIRGGAPSPIVDAGRGMGAISYSATRGLVAFAEQYSNRNVWRIALKQHDPPPVPEQFLFSSRKTDSPEFSPDGNNIAFVSDRLGTRQIWSAKADGSNSVQLSFVAPETPIGTPRWSPDGQQIVYDTVKDGHSAIGIMNSDGSHPRIFAADPWDDMMPSWSHDGHSIYFACKLNGTVQVCRKPTGGGATSFVTTNGGGEPRESPDGRFIFYAKANGLWEVARAGGIGTPIRGLTEVDDERYWTVTRDAIYFLATKRQPWIVYRYDLATRVTTPVAKIQKQPDFGSPGLAVTPNPAYLLYGQLDNQGSNIVMVEGVFPE